MQFHHDAVQFRFDCRCTHTSEEIQEKGHHGYGIVCDTQSPNGTLLAVQDTNAAAQKQRSDHKAKSSVDMQYRKQEGRNQDRIKAGVFAFENADQALMYDALGEDLLQQNGQGIQFHSQSELKIKERLSLREKGRSAHDQNGLGGDHGQTGSQGKGCIDQHRFADIPKGETKVRNRQIGFPND